MSKRLYRREFLNDEQAGGSAHVIVECDSGSERHGNAQVSISDCSRTITLDFSTYDREECRNSLSKLRTLLTVLDEFETALQERVARVIKKGFPE